MKPTKTLAQVRREAEDNYVREVMATVDTIKEAEAILDLAPDTLRRRRRKLGLPRLPPGRPLYRCRK